MVVPPCTLDTSEAKGVYQSTFRLLNLRGVDFASSIPFDRGSRPTEMDSLDRPNGVCDLFANHKRRDVPTARISLHFFFVCWTPLQPPPVYTEEVGTPRSRPILRRQKRSLDRHCSQNSPPLHWTSFQVRNRYCMCWASQHDALHLVILRLPFISGDVILFDRRQIHVRRFSVPWKKDEGAEQVTVTTQILRFRLRKNRKFSWQIDQSEKIKPKQHAC